MWLLPDSTDEVKRIRGIVDTALKLEADNAIVLAHVSEAHNYTGSPDEALSLAERACQISPSCGLAHYSAAVANILLDRIDAAEDSFATELKVAPGSHLLFASHIWRGSGQLRLRNWDRALERYAEGWRLNPLNPSICIGQLIALTSLGRHDEARERTLKLRELDPVTPLEDWQRCMRRWFVNCGHEPEMTEILTGCWNAASVTA
jgi:tetratricopeptide (TPR) repeat protein